MNPVARSLFFWVVLFGIVVLLWQAIQGADSTVDVELTFSELLTAIEDGRIEEVTLRDGEVAGRLKASGETPAATFRAFYPPEYTEFIPRLQELGVQVRVVKRRENTMLMIFLTWGPVLLIVGLWILFLRMFRSRSGYPTRALSEQLKVRKDALEVITRAAEREGLSVESWLTSHGTELAKKQLGEE